MRFLLRLVLLRYDSSVLLPRQRPQDVLRLVALYTDREQSARSAGIDGRALEHTGTLAKARWRHRVNEDCVFGAFGCFGEK